MGDHLAISGGLLQAPLNPVKTDVLRRPPGLSGGSGPFGPHRNSTTGDNYYSTSIRLQFDGDTTIRRPTLRPNGMVY